MSASQVCSDAAQAYLRLHLADGIGPITLARLLERFGGVEAVLGAPGRHLREVDGVGEKTAEAILAAAKSDGWKAQIDLAAQLGVRIVCQVDPDYPAPLRFIPDPPICLYVMGGLKREDSLSVAIVGSREPSFYGIEQADRFAGLLAGAGLTVVSGMARGVDQMAHLAALRAGGRTMAVLGCGLAKCYPPESGALRDRIAQAGAVLSELPLEVGPEAGHFPRRNRIIAGLTLGTLVIEAGERSGALITARLANEYNREVFALPGRVDTRQAHGTNDLIRRGCAKLVMSLEDILEELGEAGDLLLRQSAATREENAPASGGDGGGAPANVARPALPPDQEAVYEAVTDDPLHVEQIAAACELPIGQVSACLTLLQLRGLVRQLPGSRFLRRKPA